MYKHTARLPCAVVLRQPPLAGAAVETLVVLVACCRQPCGVLRALVQRRGHVEGEGGAAQPAEDVAARKYAVCRACIERQLVAAG